MAITPEHFSAFLGPITHEVMQDPWTSINCGHSFEKEPILTWTEKSSFCPLCRGTMTEIFSNLWLQKALSIIPPIASQRIGQIQSAIDRRLHNLQHRAHKLKLPTENIELSAEAEQSILKRESEDIQSAVALEIYKKLGSFFLVNTSRNYDKTFDTEQIATVFPPNYPDKCYEMGDIALETLKNEFSRIVAGKVIESKRNEILTCAILQKQIDERPRGMIERSCEWVLEKTLGRIFDRIIKSVPWP